MPARMLSICVVVTLLGAIDVDGAAKWVEAKSPHFTVVSDAGEKQARAVAWQFEQIRETLTRLWPWATLDFGRPVVVYAARDENSMRALVPKYFEGRDAIRPTSVFQSAPDGHYVALRTDLSTRGDPDVNPHLSSYWSYVSLVLQASIEQDLPPWMARGMAEVFSNTIVRENEVQVGRLIPWHLRALRERSRPALDLMLRADRSSPLLASGDQMGRFDASAWALVHYLMLGKEGRNVRVFNEFADAVRLGARPNEALVKAFGSQREIEQGVALHIDRSIYAFQRYGTAVAINAGSFRLRELPATEAAVALARLYAATNRATEARAQLAAAAGVPAAAEIEGILLEREGKRDEAKQAYARASEAGVSSFYGEYRFALLSRPEEDSPPRGTLATLEKSLRRSIELNARYAPAHALLADTLLRQERAADALSVAQRALELDSRDVYTQLAISRALWTLGRSDEAMSGARRALSIATTADDRKDAQEMVDFIAKASAAETVSSGNVRRSRNADERTKQLAACGAGDSAACRNLLEVLDESCRAGEKKACFLTAGFYGQGLGVPLDEGKAIGILEPLCGEGMPEACTGLGGILALRMGAADRARGKALLDKTCKGGYQEACKIAETLK
jgi:tetratricopeptide (TPR) repeat protein